MNDDRRALDLVGIAARAGHVVFGTERVREAVRTGVVRLVIVASDASANSKDKLVPMLEKRGVPVVERFDRDRLGAAIGRAPVSAVGVTESGIATRLREIAGEAAIGATAPRRDGSLDG